MYANQNYTMTRDFYLPRKVLVLDKTYTEDELLADSKFIVVLAEPGAGKTELLNSLANKLGTSAVTANFFGHVGATTESCPLVIDAFDELAKIDKTGIHQILVNARKSNPTHLIISSRSSEWDAAATHTFKEYFGLLPSVVRLCELNDAEQEAIYEHHLQRKDFSSFQAEVSRFDLETLLPNPQFLKLFADAYVESEGHFKDKRSIFVQAVERLAKEVNSTVARVGSQISTNQKIEIASEVFAKLLLSGAEGVSTTEVAEDRIYPLLASLCNYGASAEAILATRLFTLSDVADHHRHVHKIVSEYCAADYLTKRIANSSDPLTLSKCLPIIAPNSIVRDELRGLLGWMAALGNKPIQEAAIELDPYAVLANGDPSQLIHSSKRLLIQKLKEIESIDPYFRRGDFWRRFSVAGFFTDEVLDEIKPLLSAGNNGQLRNLILEMLSGSPAIRLLKEDLRQIVLLPLESESNRILASNCLLDLKDWEISDDLDALISEASQPSLTVVANIIKRVGPDTFEFTYLVEFFQACVGLYPEDPNQRERVIGGRYFINQLITSLTPALVERLLDNLTKDLACRCGKKYIQCYCRNGISKIIGLMLDHYFEVSNPPYEPGRVWQWVGNLNFHKQKSSTDSHSVHALQENDELRQGIIAYVFQSMTDRDQIFKTKVQKFSARAHNGLCFKPDDYRFIADLAFENDNLDLWASFIATHNFYRDKKLGSDNLRRHMREQASMKQAFMREWAKSNLAAERYKKDELRLDFRHKRKAKRRLVKENKVRVHNIKYVQDNRELVEGGRHWSLLVRFAELALNSPDKIEQEFGDERLVRNALRNCLDFIDEYVPDLQRLAELQCASQGLYSVTILFAACLEILKAEGDLEEVDLRLLRALRTNIQMGYMAISEEDRENLRTEVDRLIFPDIRSAEDFLRQYVEPQLAHEGCPNPQVWMLRSEDKFTGLRSALSIEWLKTFDEIELAALDTLFEIAAKEVCRDELNKVIAERCKHYMTSFPEPSGDEEIENKRTFWLVRAWYFLTEPPPTYWGWLKADKDTLIIFERLAGRFNRSERPYWPKLTSTKIEAILEAFIDKWPKVDLPNNWGTGSPKEEIAYRFLTDIIWSIDSDDPDAAIPVLERLLAESRFIDFHNDLKSIHAGQIRKRALRDFKPPEPREIVQTLDLDEIVTVEGLRQLILQELQDFQKVLCGGEFNSADRFYEKGERLGEVRATEIIAERLNLRLEPRGIIITPEHQLKSANRCDFTASKMIGGRRRLLVTEVKGQWHDELYTAASAQLHERYSIHPDAEHQGIFLIIWFGSDEKVAGRKKHGIGSADELKSRLEKTLTSELKGLIDVFVLDVSKQ